MTEEISQNIKSLNSIFNSIKKLGYIESKRKGTTGIGYTFETLIGKNEENFEIPDFDNIEIKTSRRFGKGKITLFNATPDGKFLFSIQTLCEKYGYPDKTFRLVKILGGDVTADKANYIGVHFKFKLIVDKINENIVLQVYNRRNQMIDDTIQWSFSMLKEKLDRKLKYLAIIKASNKIINKIEYFKYDDLKIYMLKDFDTFLDLIEKGIIIITFKVSVFKSGKRIGQIHDHGTGFCIKEKDIPKLYDKII
jgi:hypothetical protein